MKNNFLCMKRIGLFNLITLMGSSIYAGTIGHSNTLSLDANAYKGIYGQVAGGFVQDNAIYFGSSISIDKVSIPITPGSKAKNGGTGDVGIGYIAAITDYATLGIGAEYYPFNGPKGAYSIQFPFNTEMGPYFYRDAFAIFVTPGVVLWNGLAYVKAGYTHTMVKTEAFGDIPLSSYLPQSGYYIGGGYRHKILHDIFKGGLYAFGEYNFASYETATHDFNGITKLGAPFNQTNTHILSLFNILAGVGYSFDL